MKSAIAWICILCVIGCNQSSDQDKCKGVISTYIKSGLKDGYEYKPANFTFDTVYHPTEKSDDPIGYEVKHEYVITNPAGQKTLIQDDFLISYSKLKIFSVNGEKVNQ